MKFTTKSTAALVLAVAICATFQAAYAQVDSTGVAPLRGPVVLRQEAIPIQNQGLGPVAPWTLNFVGTRRLYMVGSGKNNEWAGGWSSPYYCTWTPGAYLAGDGHSVVRGGRSTMEMEINGDGSVSMWELDQWSGARRFYMGTVNPPSGMNPVRFSSFRDSRGSWSNAEWIPTIVEELARQPDGRFVNVFRLIGFDCGGRPVEIGF